MITLKEARLLCEKRFAKIIGMTQIKTRLTEMLLAAKQSNGFFPPLLIAGSAGLGKTRLMRTLAGLARDILAVEPLYFNDGEETGTRLTFTEKVLIPKFHDTKAWVFVDEYHKAKGNVQSLFRALMSPTVERHPVTIRAAHDMEVTYNPDLNSFVFATNEVDKLDAPFLSRVERLDLPLYTLDEMKLIVADAFKTSDIQFHDNTLETLAGVCRGTARDIVHLTNAVRGKCAVAGKKTVSKQDLNELLQARDTYPLGLTRNELQTLLLLEKHGDLLLKELATKNIVDVKEQNANERYPQRLGFIGIQGKRHLTADGRAYLADLRKHKYNVAIQGRG